MEKVKYVLTEIAIAGSVGLVMGIIFGLGV
jgi:hypothetical protein